MTRQEILYDEYENALFALLMDDVSQAQGQQALAEKERLADDPTAAMPEALQTCCARIIRRNLAAGRRSAAGKAAFRLVSRVAVVLMIMILTLTVAFAASPAMQTTVAHWAVEHYSYRLAEEAPPTRLAILSQPEDTTSAIGSSARFAVIAQGQDLIYRWQFKLPSGDWTDIRSVGTDATVLHVLVSAADNGCLFRCVVTDPNGGRLITAPAALTVASAIRRQPDDAQAAPGDSVTFSVVAEGPELSYQWQIREPGGDWVDSTDERSDTPQLTVTASGEFSGRQYRCVITDANGNRLISAPATLTIRFVIRRQPADVQAAPGDSVTFSVAVDGSELTYLWQVRDPGGNWVDSADEGSDSPQLTVAASGEFGGRQYRCIITDAGGQQIVSDPATLTVKTIITQQPSDVSALLDDTAVFTVEAQGTDLSYQWQIRINDQVRRDGRWENYYDYSAGSKSPQLSVKVTQAQDGRQYRCVVTDGSGRKTASDPAMLTVLSIISRQPVSASAAIGDTVVFTVETRGSVSSYLWQVNSGNTWQNYNLRGGESPSLAVKATAGHDVKRYRCVVTDSAGRQTISDEAILTVTNAAERADNQCGDHLFWTLDSTSQTLTVSGTGPMWDADADESLWGGVSYKKIIVEDGVTSVGDYAFCCKTLESVTLSDSVTSIGDYAFFYDENLTDVTLPSHLQRIGESAFAWCYNLQRMDLPDSVTYIGPACFREAVHLEGLRIPSAMTAIGPEAFLGANITSLVIPDTVVSIGDSAFGGCEISSLKIGAGVKSIGSYAFSGCLALSSLVIPDHVETVGEYAFLGCGISTLRIGKGMTSIGDSAFSNCTNLSTVEIPDQVTAIGKTAFYGCSSLTSLKLGRNTQTVGDSAFAQCEALTDVTLGNQLQGIGDSLFFGCTALEAVTAPASVKSVGSQAFLGCSDLTYIRFLGSAPIFADDAFQNTVTTVYYPAGNATWTTSVRRDYQGSITWISYNK